MEERKEEISTKQLLEETLRAYAWITNAVIVPGKKQGRVMVMLDGTYASTAFSADWDDDETILSVINELNFGHCAPKSK